MAVSSFAALFLAHVLADYLLQTGWLVENKRRPLALTLHIGIVFLAMPLVTLGFSPWFIVLAALHLGIDLTKTFVLKGGLLAYVSDQVLHLASIAFIVWLAPDLWSVSLLSDLDWLPRFYLILAVFLFAARGGQYAVATLFGIDPEASSRGVHVGWIERTAMSAMVALGAPVLALAVLPAKAAHVAWAWRDRNEARRQRLLRGTSLSMIWGLICAAGLWALLPQLA